MEQGVKRAQRDYSLTFKLAVVDQVEKGELTYKQAQVRYGIQGRLTVLVWLRKHGRQDWSQGASIRTDRRAMVATPKDLTPEQRIKELEQQLQVMSQKAQFFESVVDVLEKDYGVSIVKKATRQVLSQSQVEGLSIVRACQFLGISRQACYKRNRADDQRRTQGEQVAHYFQRARQCQPRIGTRKMHHLLSEQSNEQLKVGRDRLFQILAEHRLLVRPKRAYHKTTQSFHRFYRHPSLLKPGPEQTTPVAPEHVWVADITSITPIVESSTARGCIRRCMHTTACSAR